MSDELDHNRRIAGWAHAHPAKTATVADVLALRANVAANVMELAKKTNEQVGKLEKVDDEVNRRGRAVAMTVAELVTRVGRLEQAAAELLVAVTEMETRERRRTHVMTPATAWESVRMLGWRILWRIQKRRERWMNTKA